MSSPDRTASTATNTKLTTKQRFVSLINFQYLRTLLYVLKVLTIIMEICGSISVSVVYSNWMASRYYNFVAITGIVIAILSILLNLLRIVEKFTRVPWNFMEMIFDIVWAILILIASAFVTGLAKDHLYMDSYAAAAFFGFASLVLYLVDAGYRFFLWRRGVRYSKSSSATAESQKDAPTQNDMPTY